MIGHSQRVGDRIIVDLHPDDCPCEACELFRILETAVQRGWLVNPALRLATAHSRRVTPLPTGEIHEPLIDG